MAFVQKPRSWQFICCRTSLSVALPRLTSTTPWLLVNWSICSRFIKRPNSLRQEPRRRRALRNSSHPDGRREHQLSIKKYLGCTNPCKERYTSKQAASKQASSKPASSSKQRTNGPTDGTGPDTDEPDERNERNERTQKTQNQNGFKTQHKHYTQRALTWRKNPSNPFIH